MNTLEMNWLRTLKIWWYWMWRTMLASFVVAFIAGILLGIFLFPFLQSETTVALVGNGVGACIGVAFGLWVLKTLPEKEFSDFKVVLVARDTELENEETEA